MFNLKEKIKLPRFGAARSQDGIAIYIAVAVLSIVLAVALGVNLLAVNQIQNMNDAGNSVAAFAAAETGIEWALKNPSAAIGGDSGGSIGGASYTVNAATCSGHLCVTSVGVYKGTRRAIKIQL